MIHACKNPEMGRGFHFLAHGLLSVFTKLMRCELRINYTSPAQNV